jgi:hypothetical protein
MSTLTNNVPDAIRFTTLFTIFYFGAEPNELSNLPVGIDFTTVYSPSHNHGWRMIRFRVVGPRRGNFQQIETRFLDQEETAYFESLLETSVTQTVDNVLV